MSESVDGAKRFLFVMIEAGGNVAGMLGIWLHVGR